MKDRTMNRIKKWLVGLAVTFVVSKIMNYIFNIED